MATFNKFNAFISDLGNGVHNLSGDTLKIALSNTAPSAGNAVLADITQIASGSGYTTGGVTVGGTAYSQTSGVGKLVGNAVTWTASGGNIGPFRWLVLYNSTPVGKPLIAFWDLGVATTIPDGGADTFGKNTAGGNWDSGTPILTNS